jgi:predicted acetyltransferase
MRVRSPETDEERRTIARQAAETFRPQATERAVRFWLDVLPNEPGYHPGRQRVVEAQGQLVSHLRVVDREMQFGLATLRMGGICALVTSPEQRGRGYAHALMQDTVNHLTEQGFDLTCLNGIPGFYQRFGYTNVMPYRQMRVRVQDALALSSPLSVRPLTPDDGLALAELYHRCWRQRVGALVRDEAMWRWELSNPREGVVVVGENGRVRGYAFYGREVNWAAEAVAADADAVAALLRSLAQRAQEAGEDAIYVKQPADASFVRLARTLCGMEVAEQTSPGAGWQGRLLNIESAFTKLEPELSDRLARSPYVGWRGSLRLETEIGGISLFVDRSGVHVSTLPKTQSICLMPQARLTQLLFGYVTVAEAAVAPGSSIPYTASPIMAALFPPTVAYIAGLDWF